MYRIRGGGYTGNTKGVGMNLFSLIGETVRFAGMFFVPSNKDLLKETLEDVKRYREELEGYLNDEPQIGKPITIDKIWYLQRAENKEANGYVNQYGEYIFLGFEDDLKNMNLMPENIREVYKDAIRTWHTHPSQLNALSDYSAQDLLFVYYTGIPMEIFCDDGILVVEPVKDIPLDILKKIDDESVEEAGDDYWEWKYILMKKLPVRTYWKMSRSHEPSLKKEVKSKSEKTKLEKSYYRRTNEEVRGTVEKVRKSESNNEIERIKDVITIIREAKESTKCASCKRELEEMEKDVVEHLYRLVGMDVGKAIMKKKYPGRKWEELPEEAKEEIKELRDEILRAASSED